MEIGVPVDGGTLWSERVGDGPPLVLMHGAGMDSRLWDRVVGGLARSHTVVRFDARGLGRSATPGGPWSDVEDLRTVLDHHGFDRATLVGLSMGGETALDFALAYPARVSGLVLIGASVSGWRWPSTPELDAYSAARAAGDAARLAALEMSIWASMGGDLVARMVADNAARRLVSEAHVLDADRDALGRLGEIDVPTLVVDGDRDHPEMGRVADRLAAEIPDARRVTVADADHYLPLRAPERLVDLIRGREK